MSTASTHIVRERHAGYRRWVTIQSACMKGLCVVFTGVILLILVFITFYLIAKGISHLNWNIITENPIPVGVEGAPGGLKNALVGTCILIALASLIGSSMG